MSATEYSNPQKDFAASLHLLRAVNSINLNSLGSMNASYDSRQLAEGSSEFGRVWLLIGTHGDHLYVHDAAINGDKKFYNRIFNYTQGKLVITDTSPDGVRAFIEMIEADILSYLEEKAIKNAPATVAKHQAAAAKRARTLASKEQQARQAIADQYGVTLAKVNDCYKLVSTSGARLSKFQTDDLVKGMLHLFTK